MCSFGQYVDSVKECAVHVILSVQTSRIPKDKVFFTLWALSSEKMDLGPVGKRVDRSGSSAAASPALSQHQAFALMRMKCDIGSGQSPARALLAARVGSHVLFLSQ